MKTLMFALIGVLLSSNTLAGLMQADFSWSAGYLDEQSGYEYQPYESGVASFFYDDATNVISSLVLLDASSNVLFESLDGATLVFPHTIGPDIPVWDGYALDAMGLQQVPTDELFSLNLTKALAITSAVDVLPTLNDITRFGGVLSNEFRSLMFETNGLIERKAVASVPEPSSLMLFSACIFLAWLSSFRPARRRQLALG